MKRAFIGFLIAAALCFPCCACSQEPLPAGFAGKLIAAALERTRHPVTYDGSYRRIPYPLGDVPDNIGVCTDLVIRSYRAVGTDLQKEVHEDMKKNFPLYPGIWGLHRPDSNIDHRRVPNLETFFRRKGQKLPVTQNPDDYKPGDLVTWRLPKNLPHIGIVSHLLKNGRPLIIHNIGRGPETEDMLFHYPVSGHFRYEGKKR